MAGAKYDGGTIVIKTQLDKTNFQNQLKDLNKTTVNVKIGLDKNHIKNEISNALSNQNFKLNINNIKIDTNSIQQQIGRALGNMNNQNLNLNINTNNMQNNIQNSIQNSLNNLDFNIMANTLNNVVQNAFSKITNVFDKVTTNAFEQYKKSNQNLTDIIKLSGYSKEDKEFLSNYARELSDKYGGKIEDATSVLYTVAQGNFNLKEQSTKDLIETTIKSVVNSNGELDSARTSELYMSLKTSYGDRYSSRQLGNMVLKTSDIGVISQKDLLNYGSKLFTTAATNKLDLSKVLGFVSAASPSAMNKSELMVATNNMINDISKGVNGTVGKKVYEATGVDIQKILLETGDIYKALDAIRKAQEVTGEDLLANFFGNIKSGFGASMFQLLDTKMLDYSNQIKEAADSNLLNDQLDKQMEQPIVKLENTFNKLKNIVLEKFVPVIEPMLDNLANLINNLDEKTISALVTAFLGIGGAVKFILQPLSSLAFSLSVLSNSGVLSMLTQGFSKIFSVLFVNTGLVSKLSSVFSLLKSPMGALVLAIGAVIIAITMLIKNWDYVLLGLKEVWSWITRFRGLTSEEVNKYMEKHDMNKDKDTNIDTNSNSNNNNNDNDNNSDKISNIRNQQMVINMTNNINNKEDGEYIVKTLSDMALNM